MANAPDGTDRARRRRQVPVPGAAHPGGELRSAIFGGELQIADSGQASSLLTKIARLGAARFRRFSEAAIPFCLLTVYLVAL